ncbi:MAG: SMI1/KNR4 family protein [Bacillota bacterium]|nr:SMI1/KNR4 family protein [Bacillota bacterium]
MDIRKTVDSLKYKGISFESGLSLQEIDSVESLYDIKFPPDLKEFLCIALPITNNFVNWRDMSEGNIRSIKDRLIWPLEGMIFDIEHNEFWYSGWGIKPNDLKEAINVCKNEMTKVPKLIPIYSHRYIPSQPQEAGNPIFSVYQTDIIYYGEDLLSYLQIEFDIKKYSDIKFDSIKHIRFWSEL